MGSFADPKFNRGNTGYVGANYEAIMQALEGGNIRGKYTSIQSTQSSGCVRSPDLL